MKCCFIGYKEEFGSKKECKTIENIIKKLADSGVDEFYSRSENCFEFMCEVGVKKTNSKLIYVHHCIEKVMPDVKYYYDFVCYFDGYKDTATQKFYRDRYVVDVCDICLFLPCNNEEELNLLGYARRKKKTIYTIE